MFTFGGFNASTMPGLAAVLTHWPGAPDLQLHTVAGAGRDGVYYADTSLPAGRFVFDLLITHPTETLALQAAQQFAGAVRLKGQHALTVQWAPGWVWAAAVGSLADWWQDGWGPGGPSRLRSQLEFVTTDPHGYAAPDEAWEFPYWAGAATITRQLGNTPSFPTIEIEGSMGAGESVTIAVDGAHLTIDGPLAAGQVLRLDYQSMDFGIWSGDTKTASAVGRMSGFDRLTIPVGSIPVATTGNITELRLAANSRRI